MIDGGAGTDQQQAAEDPPPPEGDGRDEGWQPLRLWRWPVTGLERILAGVLAFCLVGLGAGLIGLALEEDRTARVLAQRGVSTTGTVVAVDERRDVTATVAFRTGSGRHVQDSGLSLDGTLAVGRRVPVVYDPQDPRVFLVDATARHASTGGEGDAVVAAPLLAAGLWQLVRTVHRGRRPRPA